MSADVCTAGCSFNDPFAFAGLSLNLCHCFNKRPSRGDSSATCQNPCYDNPEEACGSSPRERQKLAIYRRGHNINVTPHPAPLPTGWQYSGYFSLEGYASAIFDGLSMVNATDGNFESSVESCTTICDERGYWPFAGLMGNGFFCSNNPQLPARSLKKNTVKPSVLTTPLRHVAAEEL